MVQDIAQGSPVEPALHYKRLARLENQFADAESEILKYQNKIFEPLYAERTKIIEAIPRFWQVVIDQADEGIAEYINPQDAQLLEYLESVEVKRFNDDPRSFEITFNFGENPFLEKSFSVLSKKFVCVKQIEQEKEESQLELMASTFAFRSEPTILKWKEGNSICSSETDNGKAQGVNPLSFFDWFSWTGSGEDKFKDGEQLALFIAEDLFPNAVKYFTEALCDAVESSDEEDESESVNLESDDSQANRHENDEETQPGTKRQKLWK